MQNDGNIERIVIGGESERRENKMLEFGIWGLTKN